MKNNKKIQFLLLFFTMLIGFVFATTVNADVTKDGDVYHITTGQDLVNLLGNDSTYWTESEEIPSSIKISVDTDITMPSYKQRLNTSLSGPVDINFNNHMFYIVDKANCSFIMSASSANVDVMIHNVKSSDSNISNTGQTTLLVPDPGNNAQTVQGYLLGYLSLFTYVIGLGAANTGTITYDNVTINYPNLSDGVSRMITSGYVPIKFTGINLLVLGGKQEQTLVWHLALKFLVVLLK